MGPCYCENLECECRSEGCGNPASETVVCEYIGGICDRCASYMLPQYLSTIGESK